MKISCRIVALGASLVAPCLAFGACGGSGGDPSASSAGGSAGTTESGAAGAAGSAAPDGSAGDAATGDGACVCDPGATETDTCGFGTIRTRTCTAACDWSAWSECGPMYGWRDMAPASQAGIGGRVDAFTCWTGSEILVIGQYATWVKASDPPWGSYDPATNVWKARAPAPLEGHVTCTGQKLVIVAGSGAGAVYDPATDVWTSFDADGFPLPKVQSFAVVTWMPATGEVLVWGGYKTSCPCNVPGGAAYSVATGVWRKIADEPIAARDAFYPPTVTWTGSAVLIYGGGTLDGDRYHDAALYDPALDQWTQLPDGPMEGGNDVSAAMVQVLSKQSAALLWGGRHWEGYAAGYPTSNGGLWNGSSWQVIAPIPGTDKHEGPLHAATWSSGDRFWVWGGRRYNGTKSPAFFVSDLGWFFHPDSSSWVPISPGGPSPRSKAVAVWTGSEAVVWSGEDDAGPLDDGKIFRPCPMGQHPCNGSCLPNDAVLGCGTTSCTPCQVPPNAHATCDGASCGFECNPGFHDCGGACVSSSDVAHCGSSCSPCPTPSQGTATCDGQSCGASCDPGFTACGTSCVDTTSDDANCGACGNSCAPGFCANGACHVPEALAAGQANPVAIAVDGASVYFGEAITGGAIKKRALSGGSIVTLASGQNSPHRLALDATHVHWVNYFGGAVAQVALAGGAVKTLGTGPGEVGGIAADASGVYWTTSTGTVMKAAAASGNPTPIATWSGGQGGAIATNGTSLFWLATDTAPASGTLRKVSTSGGSATVLASGQFHPVSLALDSSSVYWTNFSNWTVMKLPLAGGTPTELVQTKGAPRGIAVDSAHVYWAEGSAIERAPIGGGPIQTIVSSASKVEQLALSATHVYYTDSTAGTVNRVAK